jgi:hypothetical protein
VPLAAQQKEGEIIIISERVCKEIDQQERENFKLFQGINGFQYAVFIKFPDNRFILKIIYKNDQTGKLKIDHIEQSIESINNIRYCIDYFGEIQTWKVRAESSREKTFCFLFGLGLPIFERWTRTIRSFKSYAYSV